MLALLVLFGGLHHIGAAVSDFPKDTNYVIRYNASCPASGFFLQRATAPNSLGLKCFLCFCQNNNTAVCWKRVNSGCDLEHYQVFGQRNSRTRRSPLSLGEVFLRDAARDFFNKQSPEQCKPFESSFSDGCPPADWCIGCTVCDCDANGHWDCHVLSFCTDKNGKKQMKKRRPHSKNRNVKRQLKTLTTNGLRSTKVTTKAPNKPSRKRQVKPNVKRNQSKQSSAVTKHKINQVKGTNVNKVASVKKALPKTQTKKAMPSTNKVTGRPLYIKKNASSNKSLHIKSRSDKSVKNNTVEVAQKVVKQFMSTVTKMIRNIDLKTNQTKQVNKVLNKRSMPKQDNKKGTKPISNVNRKEFSKDMPKYHSSDSSKYHRIKRQVPIVDRVSHESNSNYSFKLHAVNETDEDTKPNRIQNQLVNNSIGSILNVTHILNNNTSYIHMKKGMNRDVYITDNHVHIGSEYSVVKDGKFYNSYNNTDSTVLWTINNYSSQKNISNNNFKDVIFTTTDQPFLLVNFDNIISNRTDLGKNLLEEIKSSKNEQNKTEQYYANISTQTKYHSCKYRTFLQKIYGTDQYNNMIENFKASKKPKRYTILPKIKRLFKKIFNNKNSNKVYHRDDLYYRDINVKQFGYKLTQNYKLDSKEKEKLRQKIYELKSESENTLKIIRIIKGLLQILQINTNATQYKNLNGLNENINKLKIIIKDNYTSNENGKKLTEDTRTQINYIKYHVQEFIKSISKFAMILDDMIEIAVYHNKRKHKIDNTKGNKSNNELLNVAKNYSNKMDTKLERLKKLISDYNIDQNNFIYQIYVILNNLNSKIAIKDKLKPIMYSKRNIDINKRDAIETNAANITKNIRKLKLLADRFNAQKRQKREAVDDEDALEYLLILMEYLLKRHSPTYFSINDGVDLLIDAIKSAPDIKLIRKKVLDNITVQNLVTRTSTPMNSLTKYNNYSSNTVGEYKKYSSEKNNNKVKITDQSDDYNDDDEDKIEKIYRSFKSHKDFSLEQKQAVLLLRGSNISIINESYYNVQEEVTPPTSHNINNKILGNKAVYASSSEERPTTSNIIAVELDTISKYPSTVYSNVNNKFKNQAKSISNNLLIDSKANIDWIEENFKEIKQSREVDIRTTTAKNLSPTRTHKHTENTNDVTNENNLYNEEKDKKTDAEEIMSKKQLDLLNSLDYIEDEVDSKDDKYSSDTYV